MIKHQDQLVLNEQRIDKIYHYSTVFVPWKSKLETRKKEDFTHFIGVV